MAELTEPTRKSRRPAFYRTTDWVAFGISCVVAFSVYLWTLAPEVTLGWSGIYSTGAMYGGVGPPPGFPTWTLYAWVFTKILPASNIAWRIAVSSAVAGALTCGVIALMVSRGSAMLLGCARRFKRLPEGEDSRLRCVCGVVASLGLAFHGVFWNLAITVDSTALGMLLLALVLCLLMRWTWRPRLVRYLYGAAFLYGLTLTVQLSFAALAPALPVLVACIRPRLGRDLLAAVSFLLGISLWGYKAEWLPTILVEAGQFGSLWTTYFSVGIIYAVMTLVLISKSRALFTGWRKVLILVALPICGLSAYFFMAIASMTNPPVNWGYARSVEGFIHMLRLGQFERLNPLNVFYYPIRFFGELWFYVINTSKALGWPYLVPIGIPFLFLRRIRGRARSWLLGLAASFFALSVIMLIVLNPSPDSGTWSPAVLYFPASHLVLAVLAGYGLVFLGSVLARGKSTL
jgi:hypothetical protein